MVQHYCHVIHTIHVHVYSLSVIHIHHPFKLVIVHSGVCSTPFSKRNESLICPFSLVPLGHWPWHRVLKILANCPESNLQKAPFQNSWPSSLNLKKQDFMVDRTTNSFGMGFLAICRQEHCRNDVWPTVHWHTIFPKRMQLLKTYVSYEEECI